MHISHNIESGNTSIKKLEEGQKQFQSNQNKKPRGNPKIQAN